MGSEPTDLKDGQAEDVFAAGCIIAEMCMERPAFTQRSMQQFISTGQLPAFLGELPSDVHGIHAPSLFLVACAVVRVCTCADDHTQIWCCAC